MKLDLHDEQLLTSPFDMKRTFLLLLGIAISLTLQAQRISHRFVNVSMPEALSWINKQSQGTTINFIYDELEDFQITADIKNKSVIEAINTLIGFYPVKATQTETYGDGINLPKDYHHTYISVECMQKMIYNYKGIVYDNHNQPLPYANIILLNPQDSTYINGGVSNESGVFVVPCNAKNVMARISYVGYQTEYKLCMDGHIGSIHLRPTSKNLNAVVVKGEKPLVTYRGDRLVADIKGSILSKGNNGESILRLLPGVWAEKGNVSINGNSGTKIYIGDRQIHLSNNDLSTYLKSIRSEDIDKIEIIAHPSAEYEAEGQGGIIRILLKAQAQGAELNLGTNLGLTEWKQVAPSGSFSYHKGKWGFSITGNGTAWSRGKNKTFNHVELKDKDILYETPNRGVSNLRDANLSLSISYEINQKNTLLLDANWTKSRNKTQNEASTNITQKQVPLGDSETFVTDETTYNHASEIQQTDMHLHQRQHSGQFALSANYTHHFDAEGKRSLKVMVDAAKQYSAGNDQQYHYVNYDSNGQEISKEYQRQYIPSDYQIYSGEVRYTHNTLHAGQWMLGGKLSYTDFGNSLICYDEQGNDIYGQGYAYGYGEALEAIYLKYQLNKPLWDLIIGLRGEIDVPGSIKSKDKKGDTPYLKFDMDAKCDLFPSIYLTRRLGTQHALTLSYSRRTQRINYRNLLPERYHESKYEIVQGNPTLRPDYPNEVAFSYTLKGKYMLGAECSWSDNGFNANIQSTMEDGVPMYISTFRDGMKSRKLYFYLNAPLTIHKGWTMSLRPWGMARRESIEKQNTKSFCYGIVANQTITLPEDTRLTLLYIAKSDIKNGNYEELATNNLHVTLAKSFCHDHWTLSLQAYNLFYKNCLKMRYTMKDVYQTRKLINTCPSVYLTANYNIHWGKQKRNARIEHSNNEERGRL